MTENQRLIAECERKVPIYENYSNEELLAEVGQLELGLDLLDPKTEVSYSVLVDAGDRAMKHRSLREIICDENNKDILVGLIGVAITPASVASVLTVLGPMLGLAPIIVVPGALIALAVLLMKLGLNEYCQS